MPQFLDAMKQKAQADVKTIVLPEGFDDRILQAASIIIEEELARPIILGNEEEITAKGYDLEGAEIIDNTASSLREELAAGLYEIRKSKGMTEEDALVLMDDVNYFGAMLLKTGRADGLVSGAAHATKDILQAALRVIKTAPDAKMVSSFFLLETDNGNIGDDGVIMMSDCAVNINPSSEELAEIAVATAQSYTAMTGKAPRVALLSHSTKGSVKDDDAQKVVDAMALLQDRKPSFEFDGELQADAALVPSVGEKKSPGSNVAGKANVLVFPDLDAGNIGYKLAQRFGGALAYGPITQGLAMPMNDLSRGASVDDIVGVVTITAVQAQA